jgi:type IV pilus assembly protein PilB
MVLQRTAGADRRSVEDSIMKFVDLSNIKIPPTIIELLPESVARENVLIPITEENGVLQIATSNPFDLDTMQKVQFTNRCAIR